MNRGAAFSKSPKCAVARPGLKAKYQTDVESVEGRIIKRKLVTAEIEVEKARRLVQLPVEKSTVISTFSRALTEGKPTESKFDKEKISKLSSEVFHSLFLDLQRYLGQQYI